MKLAYIIGNGGFAREVEVWASEAGYLVAGLISPNNENDFVRKCANTETNVFIGLGKPQSKISVWEKLAEYGFVFPNLIHPKAHVGRRVCLGKGNIICPGVIITCDVKIGDFVTLNLNATIGHDCDIGSFSSFMPGVALSGNTTVGFGSFLGVGAATIEGVDIARHGVVGAQAFVNKNVAEDEVVVGVPARPLLNSR